MKRRFVFWAAVMLLVAMGGARGSELPRVPVSDYIRLHVVAADDSDGAQALKLEVRDATLSAARALLADCDSPDEAWARIGAHLDLLEAAATRRARALGYDGPVAAQAGVFDFPDRHYGAVFVPAGEYRALRVVIGAGEGRNWWCVLYPSLCVTGDGTAMRSALLDWLRELLGGGE